MDEPVRQGRITYVCAGTDAPEPIGHYRGGVPDVASELAEVELFNGCLTRPLSDISPIARTAPPARP